MDTPATGQTVEQGWETSFMEDCCSIFNLSILKTWIVQVCLIRDVAKLSKSGPQEPVFHIPAVENNCSSETVVGLIPRKDVRYALNVV